MAKDNALLSDAIENIFAKHNKIFEKELRTQKEKRKMPKRDLELALTVLLVELASCDQNFDMPEYNIIAGGLKRLFGTTKEEVTTLVNQANLVLSNLRGTSKFGSTLKENLTQDERNVVMEVINDVISADGREDGYETYLRQKFAGFLGVELKPAAKKEEEK